MLQRRRGSPGSTSCAAAATRRSPSSMPSTCSSWTVSPKGGQRVSGRQASHLESERTLAAPMRGAFLKIKLSYFEAATVADPKSQ